MSKMTVMEVTSFYKDQTYLHFNKRWGEEDAHYKALFVEKVIKRNKFTFKTCVDIGCGSGLVTEMIAKNHPKANFTGSELSPDAQKFWENRSKLENLKFRKVDVTSESKIYDLVVCLDVFEHVEDYFLFLKTIRRVGRRFIFNIPLDMNVLKVLTSGIKSAREKVGHLHYFNEYSATQTLNDCGFIIKDSFFSTSFLVAPPKDIRQLAILPFRLAGLALGKSLGARIFGGQSLVVYAESP